MFFENVHLHMFRGPRGQCVPYNIIIIWVWGAGLGGSAAEPSRGLAKGLSVHEVWDKCRIQVTGGQRSGDEAG